VRWIAGSDPKRARILILPPAITERLTEKFGRHTWHVTPVSGGMIHQTARVEIGNFPLFIKWGAATMAPYAAEARGLLRLRNAQHLRVRGMEVLYIPDILLQGDDTAPFLLLEWLPARCPRDPNVFGKLLGERLAALHRLTEYVDIRFGLDCDNFIGPLPQQNAWNDSWSAFYRDQRLLPQIQLLKEKGFLTDERERLLQKVCDQVEQLLDGLPDQSALLHGDLWSGNILCIPVSWDHQNHETPAVFDPAVYFGPREMEIAYTELFGGFPSSFFETYNATLPLDPGYARRRPLHQLYPLLVHYILFGEPYGAKVEAICRDLLA